MNEIKKAKIFRVILEEGYTCMINFYVLNDEGREVSIQGFGGKQLHTNQDYNNWKNGIENIINRRLEDSKGATIKVIITESEDDILGIGNLDESYWITKEKDAEKTEFNFINNKEKIDRFFEKNNIEHKVEAIKKDSTER